MLRTCCVVGIGPLVLGWYRFTGWVRLVPSWRSEPDRAVLPRASCSQVTFPMLLGGGACWCGASCGSPLGGPFSVATSGCGAVVVELKGRAGCPVSFLVSSVEFAPISNPVLAVLGGSGEMCLRPFDR